MGGVKVAYQSFKSASKKKGIILANMYSIINSSVRSGLCTFKGGYVLSQSAVGIRYTSDIDVDVYNEDIFYLIYNKLFSYLNQLKDTGEICGYSSRPPKVKNGREVSGYIKLFVKRGANAKKIVLCGIDFGFQKQSEGLVVLPTGHLAYSYELMLGDKVSALYSLEKNLMHRVRDIIDIYLIINLVSSLNRDLVLNTILCNGVDLQNRSTFENIVKTKRSVLVGEINKCLSDGERYNEKSIKVSADYIISSNIKLLFYLRGGI